MVLIKEPPDCGNSPAEVSEVRGQASLSAVNDSRNDPRCQQVFSFAFPLTDSPSCYVVALAWLDAGVELVPLQPHSKHLIAGYGPHLKHVADYDGAWYWFGQRKSNIGIVTGSGLCVLDIDEPPALDALLTAWPELRDTFTVKTKRGVHLYLQGAPADLRSFTHGGVEVKAGGAAVTTWPSRIGDMVYSPLKVTAPILPVPVGFVPQSEKASTPVAPRQAAQADDDLVTRIKASWTLAEICKSARITLYSNGGRFAHGACPMHGGGPENFFVDYERGTFGCHACNFHGDAINLFAFVHHVELRAAVRLMARRLT